MRAASLLSLALCAGLAPIAQAQTVASDKASISFYGIVDVGVGTEAHSQNWSPSVSSSTNPLVTQSGDKAVTGLFTGGISCSRLGIRADYKINEDWKAVFNAEAALDATSGQLSNWAGTMSQPSTGSTISADSSLSGQLFARAFYVGLASDTYGTVTFGRNPSLILDLAPSIDPMSAAQLFSPIGFSGTYGGGGGSTDNARMDNSIKYKVNIGNFNLGLLYKFGNVSGSTAAGSGTGVNLGFNAGGLDVQVAYQALTDAGLIYNTDLYTSLGLPGTATTGETPTGPALTTGGPLADAGYMNPGVNPYNSITVLWANTTAALASVKYKTGAFTFRVGGEYITIGDPSNPTLDGKTTTYLGQQVSLNLTGLFGSLGSGDLNGGYKEADNKKCISLWWAGAAWDVTPKFNIALGYYSVVQNNFSGTTTLAAGTDHFSGSGTYTSVILDYHFAKRFDGYVGYMGDTVKGGMDYNAYNTLVGGNQMLHNTNSMMGAGIRLVF